MAKVIRAGKILVCILLCTVLFTIVLATWTKAVGPDEKVPDPNAHVLPSNIEVINESLYRSLLSEECIEDIGQRGPNRRVWQNKRRYAVVNKILGTVEVEEYLSNIIEMGSGLCYPDNKGEWQITECSWQEAENGFVMDKAGYRLSVGKTLDSWLEYTVDEIVLLLRPSSLVVTDGYNKEIFSDLKDGIVGIIDPNDSSRLIFSNAFGEGIDVELCVYPDRYHQNIIFRSAPKINSSFNNVKLSFQVHTEINMDDYLKDGMIDVVIGDKHRFELGNYHQTGLSKEEIRFKQRDIQDNQAFEYTIHRFSDSKIEDRMFKAGVAAKQLHRDDLGNMYLVESLDQTFLETSQYPVVWDYQTVNGYWDPNDSVWSSKNTYYISSDLTIDEGELWIEPGTFIKFNDNTKLSTSDNGVIIARGKPHLPIVFTSKYDTANGEAIDTSRNPGHGDFAGIEIGEGSSVEYCKIFCAVNGLEITGSPLLPIQHNHINQYSGNGIKCVLEPNETVTVFNNLLNNGLVSAVQAVGTGGTVLFKNNTVQNSNRGVYVPDSNSVSTEIQNNIFIWCSTAALDVDPNNQTSNNHNGFWDNTAEAIGVELGSQSVIIYETPWETDPTGSFGYRYLNRSANAGEMFKDAGFGSVVEAGYTEPNLWAVHYPANLYMTAAVIDADTVWQPDYTSCDTGIVALGYHHPRVDYLISNSNVTIVNSTLTVKPGTVVAHSVDATTGTGKVTIDGTGAFKCNGQPFDNGHIIWVEKGRAASHRNIGVPLSNAQTYIQCYGPSETSFAKFLGLGGALCISNNDAFVHDNYFYQNKRGLEFSWPSEFDCINCLFVQNYHGLMERLDATGTGQIMNCSFVENWGGVSHASGGEGDIQILNSLFVNNEYAIRKVGTGTCVESNNAFYSNLAYPVFSQFGDLSTMSWSDPQCASAQLLNGNPFDPNWTNWDRRFCLLPGSYSVDNGYDPDNNGMCGYTTFVNGVADANAIDIGFHRPIQLDTDGDLLLDYEEYWAGSSPYSTDTDGDGLSDYQEVKIYGTNPANSDTDGDDLPDKWEIDNQLDPLNTSGADGKYGDPDGDGITNYDEYCYGLNPLEDNRGLYETQNEYDDAGQVILSRSIDVSQQGVIYVTESRTVYDVLGRPEIQRQVAVPGRGPGRGPDDTKDRIRITQYDAVGNVQFTVQKIVSSGIAGDPNNLLIDPNDIIVENVYDCLGRLESVIDPEGHATSYTYTLGGSVETITDPNGNVTTNIYDGAGRLERTVDPLGHSRTMGYDSLGRVIRQVVWEDTNRTPADFSDDTPLMQTRSLYDGLGHVVRQAVLADASMGAEYAADPNTDKVTDFVYDGATDAYPGMLTAQKLYFGGSPCTIATTAFEYDLLGRRNKTTDPAGNETILAYDIAGRLKERQQIDKLAGRADLVQKTSYEYDNHGRLWKLIADPNGFTETQTTEYVYGLSYRVQETKPNGVINVTQYNTFGQKVASIADAAAGGIRQVTLWDYDRAGRQISVTGYVDENNPEVHQTTVYDYDKNGNVKTITYPDQKTINYVYNELGKVWKRTDQRGLHTYYRYDDGGNLQLKTNDPFAGKDWSIISDPNYVNDPNANYFAESFTYDGAGRQWTAVKVVDDSEISRSVFGYNDLGLVSSEAQVLFGGTGRVVSYGYDQYGYRTSTTYPDGSTVVSRTNTWDGRIDTLSRGGAAMVDYGYQGQRTGVRGYHTTVPVTAEYAYDHLGRVTDIAAGTGVDFHYDYVANENNIWKKRFDHRNGSPYNAYSYDDIDRLARADYLKGLMTEYEAFNMDDLGNRQSTTLRDGSGDTYAVDALTNRYTSVGGNSLAYDDAGNLTQDKDGYRFTYDHENRIIEVRNSSDSLVAQMDYDSQGRRIKVYDAVADTTTLYYYSDNWQVLSQYTGTTLDKSFVYGNYIDEVLVMLDDAGTCFYLHDHLYSPIALLNASGTVVERYEYDAYGKTGILSSGFSPLSSSSYGNHILFNGRELDVLDNASLQIMHYRHRAYNPQSGWFMQQDPHGINPNGSTENLFRPQTQYMSGINLYQYNYSCPILFVDPYGLWGPSVHSTKTRVWARRVDYPYEAASAVAAADNAVDHGSTSPIPIFGNQAYHFNRNLSGGEDTRITLYRKHYMFAQIYCIRGIDMPEEAARELGTSLHPLQDWVAHADYALKNKGNVWVIHNANSPQSEFGDPGGYPDDPTLDVVGSPDGRATRAYITDYLKVEYIGAGGPAIYEDFAYYEKGTKRYEMTRRMTIDELMGFRWYVSIHGGCRCKKYFGVDE